MSANTDRKEQYIAAAGLLERYRRGDSRHEMFSQALGDDSDRYFPPAPVATMSRWLATVMLYIEREDAAGRLDELEARVTALRSQLSENERYPHS